MSEPSSYYVEYPDDLDDRGWIDVTSRGSLFGVRLVIGDERKTIIFYDEFSFAESIRHEIRKYGYYCEGIVVVVPSVTHANVENAIRTMASYGFRDLS